MIILDGWQASDDEDIDVITYHMNGSNSAVAISIEKIYDYTNKIRLCVYGEITSIVCNKDLELVLKIWPFVINSKGNPPYYRIYELPKYSFNVGQLKQELKNTLLKCDGVKFITEEMKLLL